MRRALLALGAVLALVLTPTAVASGQESGRIRALDRDVLGDCVSETKKLAALFLVDTSLSLRTTDTRNERVSAIQSALSGLSALKEAADVEVITSFLEFGTTTKRSFPSRAAWFPLPDSADEQTQLAEAFSDRNTSEDTDYVAALEPWLDATGKPAEEIGAIEMLEQAPEGSCRLLVWFTDGMFDLDYFVKPKTVHWTDPPRRYASDAEGRELLRLGRKRLCEAGGLADRLRAGDNITTGAQAQTAIVALDPSGTLNFDLIASIATGGSEDQPCGKTSPRGSFLRANQLSDLALALRSTVLNHTETAVRGAESCVQEQSGDCAFDPSNPAIESYDVSFDLASALSGFNLLTISASPSVTTSLITPDGNEYPLDASGNQALRNGASVRVRRLQLNSGGFLLDADLPKEGGWEGTWRLRYRTSDPKVAKELNKASLYVFGGLQARLANTNVPLRKGRTGKIVVELVTPAGRPATATSFATNSSIVLKVNGAPQPAPAVSPDGTFEFPYDVPASLSGNTLTVEATLNPVIQLAPDVPPVVLEPWSATLGTLEVKDVPKYPIVDAPGRFEEAINQDRRVIETVMTVDATGEDSGGCISLVRISPPTIDQREANVELRLFDGTQPVELGKACAVQVPAGTKKDLTLRMEAPDLSVTAASRIAAGLTLRSESALSPESTEEFTYDVAAAVEPIFDVDTEATVWIWVIVSVLAPILLLYAVNIIGAKLDVGMLTAAELPVVLRNGRLMRFDDGVESRAELRESDISGLPLAAAGRHREVRLGGASVRARWSWNPFDDIYAESSAPGSDLVVSNLGTTRGGTKGRLDPSLTNAWVFRADHLLERDDNDAGYFGILAMAVPAHQDLADLRLQEEVTEIAEVVAGAFRASQAGRRPQRTLGKPDTSKSEHGEPDGMPILRASPRIGSRKVNSRKERKLRLDQGEIGPTNTQAEDDGLPF